MLKVVSPRNIPTSLTPNQLFCVVIVPNQNYLGEYPALWVHRAFAIMSMQSCQQPIALSDLGHALLRLYEYKGETDDLQKAISLMETVISVKEEVLIDQCS